MIVHPDQVLKWLVAGFTLTVVATAPLIRWLEGMQYGKTLRRELGALLLPPAHAQKEGVATMGGLGMLAVLGLAGLILWPADRVAMGWVLGVTFSFAAIGLLDDLAGLGKLQIFARTGESGVGFPARVMLSAQVLVAGAAGALASKHIPLHGLAHVAPAPVIGALLAILAIVGTATGVNFSDGLDGLAAGLLAVAYAALAAAAWRWTGATTPVAFAFAASGACLGFLVFNRHPARVFMGNVASMGLGAGLAAVSLVTGVWPILPIVGAVFVAEVVSVMLQVSVFKTTGGRRLFRMAPLHHHFEMLGWAEQAVVRRFWIAGLALALLGLVVAAPFHDA